MARPILVPQVGQDLTEGKLVALHVKVGDKVAKGDIVAAVESEKATFDVEAFDSGVVIDIRYKVGDTAEVLKPLLFLGRPGEIAESFAPGLAGREPAKGEPKGAPAAPDTPRSRGPVRSSPLARRLAAQNGLDIAHLSGSGPGGSIVKRDIERALAAKAAGVGSRAVKPTVDIPATVAKGSIPFRTLQNGSGDPIIFLHGFGAELAAWRPFVGNVGVANPMMGFDLPGHGQSADLPAANFDDLVDSTAAALSQAGFARAHLVGHSLGAAVAAVLAGAGGLDIRSLTLLAPAGLGPKINGDFIAGFLAAATEPALKAWMEMLVFDPANLPGAMVRQTLATRAGGNVTAKQGRLAAALFEGNTQLFSVRDALNRFEGTARIIVGQDDMIIPAEYTNGLPGRIALHKLLRIGHLPQLETNALVGRLVKEAVRSAS